MRAKALDTFQDQTSSFSPKKFKKFYLLFAIYFRRTLSLHGAFQCHYRLVKQPGDA